MKKYYAHNKSDLPPEEWQPLETHLKNVVEKVWKLTKEDIQNISQIVISSKIKHAPNEVIQWKKDL